MSTMIDDLLTFSRVGRAALTMEAVELIDVVAAARADVGPECVGRDITWDVQLLPRVHGDAGLLRLAIVNLLSNAVKYTRGRTPARITIGSNADVATGDQVVWVRDNGAGFAMASAGKLFGVFQRLHENAEFEGTGIGLASVRRIVARHGGRVWADASVGEGATFFLSLPPSP
jgi:light-regulated signal transduction histidine kinase (bacteriophytochrome)